MLRGARFIIPFGLGAALYGFAFGVLAAQVGIPSWGVGLMGGAVFDGSSQIVAVEQFRVQGPVVGAAIAGMAMSLRSVGTVASLSDVLRHTPLAKRLLAVHLTSDENGALTMADRARDPGVGDEFLIGSGLLLLVFWTASTALGAMIGAGMPDLERYGIGFAFTAAFVAMGRGPWRGRRDLLPFAASFVVTAGLVSMGTPTAFAILGGAAIGVASAAIRRRTNGEHGDIGGATR